MKRAVIIVTEAQYVWGNSVTDGEFDVPTSGQLLADLRTLVKAGEWATTIADWNPHRRKENELAAARVRALLPKEGEGDEDA